SSKCPITSGLGSAARLPSSPRASSASRPHLMILRVKLLAVGCPILGVLLWDDRRGFLSPTRSLPCNAVILRMGGLPRALTNAGNPDEGSWGCSWFTATEFSGGSYTGSVRVGFFLSVSPRLRGKIFVVETLIAPAR